VNRVLRIGIVGAESTGKTALAAALAARLAQDTGRRVAWVPEWLRQWCEAHGRTPRAEEQADVMHTQHRRIDAAAALNDIVVCDTTALMTAVYSRQVFSDRSLDAAALALHRGIDMTLLTALDLPWVPDGLQRDGPHVRRPVDAALRELLLAGKVPFAEVQGQGAERLANALTALTPLLRLPAPY
jgi:nicotinamide riboside kinase